MNKQSSPTMPSVVPPSRYFAAPSFAFDTEVAVLGAACVTRDDREVSGVQWIASTDLPDAPLWAVIDDRDGSTFASGDALSDHLLSTFRRGLVPGPAERTIVVSSPALADRLTTKLVEAGLSRSDDTFFGIAASRLAEPTKDGGARLILESVVGDEPWRHWGMVERSMLDERFPHEKEHAINDALVDRIVEFKRRQQRSSPPIRRFLARDSAGDPIAMIGYAPFAACDLGFAPRGVLARLRDVAVVPRARRTGVARALLRAIAERAIAECDATQVLIGAVGVGAPLALYRSIDARPVDRFVTFRGAP